MNIAIWQNFRETYSALKATPDNPVLQAAFAEARRAYVDDLCKSRRFVLIEGDA